ncbi:MAG: hypothetical protein KDB10_24485, partial [Acidimicrobiales bacterium]|nr:hypothetical protein [Acidimicrobiales bacterium]
MACTTGAGAELRWSQDDRDAVLQIAAPRAPATSIRFSACEGRIVPHLVLLEGRRAIDVSIQPGLVARLVGADTAALGRVASWVAGFARAQGAWAPADPAEAGVTAVVLGGAFPLVGAALDAGAAALPDVPRWAAATLSAASARAGARVAFAGRATRPVVSALAESLVSGLAADRTGPDGRPVDAAGPVPPALYPLALGLMAPALSPDRLSRVLRAVEPWRPLRHWPERASLVLVAGLTPALGEQRTERLLLDAARRPDGPSELAEAFQLYALVRHRAGPRLPSRVADLRAHCRALLPADPNPGGVPAAPRPRPQSAPRRRRAPADAPRP